MEISIDPVSGRIECRDERRHDPLIDATILVRSADVRGIGVRVTKPLAPKVELPS